MVKKKVSKQIQKLFSPELLAKAQQEAELQSTSLDDLLRTAVEKYLRALSVVREQQEAQSYARLLLRAHFTEDRNEFLTDDAIRAIGQTPPAIGDGKSQ